MGTKKTTPKRKGHKCLTLDHLQLQILNFFSKKHWEECAIAQRVLPMETTHYTCDDGEIAPFTTINAHDGS